MENSKQEDWNRPQPNFQPENKKVVAGVLALILGSLGIHKFILGYTTEGELSKLYCLLLLVVLQELSLLLRVSFI